MATILITGGHGGIGLAAVRYLAGDARMNIVLAGRSLERIEPVAAQLRKDYGVKVTSLLLDTASLGSVREAAVRIKAMLTSGEIDSLQAILCNAGARFETLSYTPDGYEETFATNCLGHLLLVELLIDSVAPEGRVVFTSSGTHDPHTMDGRMVGAPFEPDAMALANAGKPGGVRFSGGRLYTTSKLCNILTAYELDRRLRHAGSTIAAIAFDPGLTTGTGFLRGLPAPVRAVVNSSAAQWLVARLGVTMGSVTYSGGQLGRIAVDPAFAGASGKYFQSNDGRLIEARSSRISYDADRARKLWEGVVKLVHLDPSEESPLLR